MTLVEKKAKNLVDKYSDLMEFGIWNGTDVAIKLNKGMAKQSALIAVDEILSWNQTLFWENVKLEIEKL